MIVIKGLVKRYGSLLALDHLDLQVGRGMILGLLGPNGAGKTTLVSVLNGLTGFQQGRIEIFGLPLADNICEIRSRSAYIPQSLALYESLTVLENLQFFSSLLRLSQKRRRRNLDHAIGVNRLEKMLDRRVSLLSGGQKQRLNIGIGLLNDPELLYFDEPTAGIDPELRNDILDSITTLAGGGKTVIYTSHYLPEIEKICDQAAIIHKGKILRQGDLAAMLAHKNRNNAVVELAGKLPELPVVKAVGRACHLERLDDTTLLIEDATADNMAEILRLLERQEIGVRQIRYGAASLESLYLRIIAGDKNV